MSQAEISQQLQQLAAAIELTEKQIEALSSEIKSVQQLSSLDPKRIARQIQVPDAQANELVSVANLLALLDIPLDLAISMAKHGITVETISRKQPEQILKELQDQENVSSQTVFQWILQIQAQSRAQSDPRKLDCQIPESGNPSLLRKIVVDQETSWPDLIKIFYGIETNSSRVLQLASANRSQVDSKLLPGLVVTLPDIDQTSPKLKDIDSATNDWLNFTSKFLTQAEAKILAENGFLSPQDLAIFPPCRAIAGVDLGISLERAEQLRSLVWLACHQGVSRKTAYYLAIHQPRSLATLARTDLLDLSTELAQAQAIGFLEQEVDTSPIGVGKWLGDLVFACGIQKPRIPETSVCPVKAEDLPIKLENYYTYRFYPNGKRADEIQLEINAKTQWLAEVNSYLSGDTNNNSDKLRDFKTRGFKLIQAQVNDVDFWGINDLRELRNFVLETLPVSQLLHILVEGHEAYHHRQYSLALASYQRAENWFSSLISSDLELGDAERWWKNVPNSEGIFKPIFLNNCETYLGQEPINGSCFDDTQVHSYYEERAKIQDERILLDHVSLERDFEKYSQLPLMLSKEGPAIVPFRKYLYYIKNFMLPMLKADCHLQLGNYCAALSNYFQVHYDEKFVKRFSGTQESKEDDIAKAGKYLTAVSPSERYPSLLSFYFEPPPDQRFYPEYLHDIEKRVVELKVAETLLKWGDFAFRQSGQDDSLISDAERRYAQVIRVFYGEWSSNHSLNHKDFEKYQQALRASDTNPIATSLAVSAQQQLMKISQQRNFLGYPKNYVPVWTYSFLLSSARYFCERARQLGRDSLQFLASAEQEQGNQRLLLQALAVSQGQLAIESRRVEEAEASLNIANVGKDLAFQRKANNDNRKEELENFAPYRQALGIVGGAIGGAGSGSSLFSVANPSSAVIGLGVGATYGAVSSYISGVIETQAQSNELGRQRLELEKSQDMADAEYSRANISVGIAELSRDLAALTTVFSQSNLAYAQTKSLNAEFWFETSRRLSEIAEEYLEQAIGVAFLAEQAFEFMERRRLDVIRFDYSQAEGVLSAEALLSDLDSIEYERVTARQNKTTPIKRVIRLREIDFVGFSQLKQTGSMTFETSLFDFDMSHAGSYHQRIARVEVEVLALVPPDGIRGTLRKSGLSYLRYYKSQKKGFDNTQSDWIVHTTPLDFGIAPVIQPAETLILSPFDIRQDSVALRPDPGEELRVFEGSGVGATWTLSLRTFANDFDLSTIADVNLVIYYYAQYDQNLERIVNLERQKLIALGHLVGQKTRGFSFQEIFPDAFYLLHNPSYPSPQDPWQERTVQINVSSNQFPPNQINRRLKGITLGILSEDGYLLQPVELVKDDFIATWDTTASGLGVLTALGEDQSPEGTWSVTIRASYLQDENPQPTGWALPERYQVGEDGRVRLDNTGKPILLSTANSDSAPDTAGETENQAQGIYIFDPDKIKRIQDIFLLFNYQYKQAGNCGDPLVFWVQPSQLSEPLKTEFVNDQRQKIDISSWKSHNLDNTSGWSITKKEIKQSNNSSKSIYQPEANLSLSDLRISTQLRLPKDSDAAGIVFLYNSLNARETSYYSVTLTRQSSPETGNYLEITLNLIRNSQPTSLEKVVRTSLVTLTSFELAAIVKGSQIEVMVNEITLLNKTVTSEEMLPAGSIGLYADGEASFSEVLVYDLTDR